MAQSKVHLTEEKATLLITLLAKAEDSKLPDSILQDRFALNVIEQIDYDFDKLKVSRNLAVGFALRAKVLDDWARGFISEYPNGTVLNMGCGLDSRVFRVDPPNSVRWFDVDYPEVIELRHAFYPARTNGYSTVATSVTAQDWLERLEISCPVLVIAEGLLYYLTDAEVEQLLNRILAHCKSGELIFDVYSRLGVKIANANGGIKHTGAVLKWSIEDPHELERKHSQFKLLEEHRTYGSNQASRMSLRARMLLAVLRPLPMFNKLVRLLRYSF